MDHFWYHFLPFFQKEYLAEILPIFRLITPKKGDTLERKIFFLIFFNIPFTSVLFEFFFCNTFEIRFHQNDPTENWFLVKVKHAHDVPRLTLSRCENIPSQIFSTWRNHIRPSGAGTEAEQRDTTLQLLEHAILSVGSRVRAVRL